MHKNTKYTTKIVYICQDLHTDSNLDGVNVYETRYKSGRLPAQEAPVKADWHFVPDREHRLLWDMQKN